MTRNLTYTRTLYLTEAHIQQGQASALAAAALACYQTCWTAAVQGYQAWGTTPPLHSPLAAGRLAAEQQWGKARPDAERAYRWGFVATVAAVSGQAPWTIDHAPQVMQVVQRCLEHDLASMDRSREGLGPAVQEGFRTALATHPVLAQFVHYWSSVLASPQVEQVANIQALLAQGHTVTPQTAADDQLKLLNSLLHAVRAWHPTHPGPGAQHCLFCHFAQEADEVIGLFDSE